MSGEYAFHKVVIMCLKEIERLREMYEEATHHLDLMVERFGIEALAEMVGEDE